MITQAAADRAFYSRYDELQQRLQTQPGSAAAQDSSYNTSASASKEASGGSGSSSGAAGQKPGSAGEAAANEEERQGQEAYMLWLWADADWRRWVVYVHLHIVRWGLLILRGEGATGAVGTFAWGGANTD